MERKWSVERDSTYVPRPFAEIGQAVVAMLLALRAGPCRRAGRRRMTGRNVVALAAALGLVEDGQETDGPGTLRDVTAHALLHTSAVAVR